MSRNWKFPFLLTIVLFGLATVPNGFAAPQNRQIYGFVYSTSGQPISGATVSVSKCSYTQIATTGSNGYWQMSIPYGLAGSVTFSANGFQPETFQLNLNVNWPYAGGTLSLQPTTWHNSWKKSETDEFRLYQTVLGLFRICRFSTLWLKYNHEAYPFSYAHSNVRIAKKLGRKKKICIRN